MPSLDRSERNLKHMNAPTTPWSEIQAFLATANALLPAVEERPRLTVQQSSPTGLQDAILQLLRETIEEATRSIIRLHGDNTWPDISPKANIALAAFFDCALNLPTDPTPEVESSELEALHIAGAGLIPSVRRLYMTWWMRDGIKGWIQLLKSDRTAFDSYFVFDPI
jgi:hypothetical protein